MKYVYVLMEEGSWDFYDSKTDVIVFSTFEKALEEFNQRVANAKVDLEDWRESDTKMQEELNVNKDDESASFEAYEDGYYERLHSNITITKEEVK